jgi:hypothetical protein
MVMSDWQWDPASALKHMLVSHAHLQGHPWYVASMLPIIYAGGEPPARHQVAPDCFVAFAVEHERSSYDLAEEGICPSFVLEIVSPSSERRDKVEKPALYAELGVAEYLLFTPPDRGPAVLDGYRRDAAGAYAAWPPEPDGSLWSEALALYLFVEGRYVRVRTSSGERLLLPEEEARERRRAQRAVRQAEQARREAEMEAKRLREELARLRGEQG